MREIVNISRISFLGDIWMFDYLQGIFWSLTYICLIIYAIKFKAHGIPLVAICLNFAWETVALANSVHNRDLSSILIIHILWFSLDLIIVNLFLFQETRIYENKKPKLIFIISYICLVMCFWIFFEKGYMLLLSYLSDLIMAIAFYFFVLFDRVKQHCISYLVGFFKFFGDMFAWLYYRDAVYIEVIGIIVLICNIAYIVVLLKKSNLRLLVHKINEKKRSHQRR